MRRYFDGRHWRHPNAAVRQLRETFGKLAGHDGTKQKSLIEAGTVAATEAVAAPGGIPALGCGAWVVCAILGLYVSINLVMDQHYGVLGFPPD